MAFWAVMGFVLAIIAMSEITRLKKHVKKLENGSRGEEQMSQLIKELVGQQCIIDEGIFSTTETYDVLAADDEWLKIRKTTEKGKVETRLVRIENIKEIRPV
ncbi:hypothetical protein [Streptococcus fryi]